MWKSVVDGQTLHFHLAGINNQNFIMEDEETGTWWQQVSGQAIRGPLKGKQLEGVPWDEVNFGIWARENPHTMVLLPDEGLERRYAPVDWDKNMAEVPVATTFATDGRLAQRELVAGVTIGDAAKAYPMPELIAQSPISDRIGSTAILLVIDNDGRSVRCFDRTVAGERLDLFLKPDSDPLVLVDAQTGSEWDFSGTAISGPLEGRTMARIQVLKDYWFDWNAYHPDTSVYTAGKLPSRSTR